MDTFDLRLTFSGLCMFVPAKDGKTMHVLMPVTGSSTGHPQHLSRLYHHPAFATGTGNPSTPKKPAAIDIEGRAIQFKHQGTLTTALPDSIVKISDICGRKVDPELLEGAPHGPVAARISMTSGQLGKPNDGLIWDIDGTSHELASLVTWTIRGIPGNTLTVSVGGVDHTFHAISNAIDLNLFNVPSHEVPDEVPLKAKPIICPPKGHMAHHFMAFYDILGCTGHNAPKFLKGKFKGQCSNQATVAAAGAGATTIPATAMAAGVSPVTCMLGGGDGGP
jgi:hypothetical protein